MIVFIATHQELEVHEGSEFNILGAFHGRSQAIDACRELSEQHGPDDCEDWEHAIDRDRYVVDIYTISRHEVPRLVV